MSVETPMEGFKELVSSGESHNLSFITSPSNKKDTYYSQMNNTQRIQQIYKIKSPKSPSTNSRTSRSNSSFKTNTGFNFAFGINDPPSNLLQAQMIRQNVEFEETLI